MAKGLKPGDEFSFLTLKEKRYVKGNGSKGKMSWVCVCVCGTEVVRRQDLFVEGKSMSCGCRHPSRQRRGRSSPNWKGCGDLSGQFFGLMKNAAETRGIAFELTIGDAWDLFVQQGRRCALTGVPLKFVGDRDRRRGLEQTASLDRIDSTKGYVLGNVHWVHKDVNMMKKEYPLERFIEICRLVAAHQPALAA